MRRGKQSLLMFLCSICTAALMMLWPGKPVILVKTAVVQRGELVQSVLLSGTVRYAQEQPLVSLKSGLIANVYAEAGQTVQSGDLLFQLDTAAEEQALTALYEMKYAYQASLAELDGAVAALTMQTELEWRASEAQLMAGIEASQIRASADGVVEAIYVEAGDHVAETALLGMTRGMDRQIAAAAYANEISGVHPGAAAVVTEEEKSFSAVLRRIEAANDASGLQMLWFEPLDKSALSECRTGENVQVELATSVSSPGALIPLSATDAEGKVWFVENGKAYGREADFREYSRTDAAAEMDWVDRTIILYPEQYDLKDGMPVRVMK